MNNDNALGMILASAIEAQAKRPQKTSQRTDTVTTEIPLELADMRMRRDTIGNARKALAESLAKRESDMGYALGNALANYGGQSAPGQIDWASGIRALGGGLVAPTNFNIDRMQRDYDNSRMDLADALMYDKAMGSQARQISNTALGYDEGAASMKGAGTMSGAAIENANRSVGYDPIENIPDFGPITRAALSEEQMNPILKYVPLAQSTAKAVTDDKTRNEVQTLWGDISDNILSGRVLDFVGKAGSIRVADTPAEQQFIFGPIRDYQSNGSADLRANLLQARNRFVSSGMNKARVMGLPVTEKDLVEHWNSMFTVPESKKTKSSYNTQDRATSSFLKGNSNNKKLSTEEILQKYGAMAVE